MVSVFGGIANCGPSDAYWYGRCTVAHAVFNLRGKLGISTQGEFLASTAATMLLFSRSGAAAEHTHLIEYSLLGMFVYNALLPRWKAQKHNKTKAVWVAMLLLHEFRFH